MYRLVCRGPWFTVPPQGYWFFPYTYTLTTELYDVVYGAGWMTDIFTKVQIYAGGILHEAQVHVFAPFRLDGPFYNLPEAGDL